MTGNGKIARLPLFIRNQLNERLQNGEESKGLVRWLNGLRVVKEILKEKFGGRPISEQNLSEWKQRGYQDWLKREEKRALLRDLLDEAEELEEEVGETPLTDRLTETVALALGQLLRLELKEGEKGPKQRAALLEITRELARLREGDHAMERLRLQTDRWEIERERMVEEDHKREIQEMKDRATGRIWGALQRPNVVKVFGGGEAGEKIADLLDEINDLPSPPESPRRSKREARPSPDSPEKPKDQTESNQIKPNQTKKSMGGEKAEPKHSSSAAVRVERAAAMTRSD